MSAMISEKLSSKNQIVIPASVRKRLKLSPGQRPYYRIASKTELELSIEPFQADTQ